MGEMLLPWPRRRPEPGDDGEADNPPVPPHYELQRVDQDGSRGAIELLPITSPPWKARMGRRGFLGAGIASSAAAAMLLSACDRRGSSSPPPTSYTPPPSYPSYPTYSEPSYPTYSESPSPTSSEEPPTTDDGGGYYGGGGGTICTCNKVCTCIPVCQAHRLLDPDPVVRRMAETTVTAMGIGQQRYLAWAARNASAALADRIDALVDELRQGRTVRRQELEDHDYARYLTADDQVTRIMAAQVLSLRATTVGERVQDGVSRRVAALLEQARDLHRRRAPLWGH